MDLLLDRIFDLVYHSDSDTLVDLTYNTFCDSDLDELYNQYCSIKLNNLIVPEMENKNRKAILNLAIYIYKEIVPMVSVIDDLDYYIPALKIKISEMKQGLYDKVVEYATSRKKKKYILKELESNKQNKLQDQTSFIKGRLSIIKDWANNGEYILSNFFYAEDLQFSQKRAIIKAEAQYLLLLHNGINIIETSSTCSLKADEIQNDGLAKIPLIAFIDGIWRPDGLTNKSQLQTENLITILPDDDVLEKEFNGVILCTQYEMSVYGRIVQFGQNYLTSTNKVTFTIPHLAKSLGLSVSGQNYERLEFAIKCLKARQLHYRYYDQNAKDWRTKVFSLLSSIDFPTYNSHGEKEWTVEIDTFIKEQILLAKYKSLNPIDIFNFKSALSHSLLSVIVNDSIIDIGNNTNCHEYTLANLSSRTFLTGKPSDKKKRLIASFTEILNMPDSPIVSFDTNEDKNRFYITYQREAFTDPGQLSFDIAATLGTI